MASDRLVVQIVAAPWVRAMLTRLVEHVDAQAVDEQGRDMIARSLTQVAFALHGFRAEAVPTKASREQP